MTYYKIILDNQIIGVCTSASCYRFQSKHNMLERSTEIMAEYISYMNILYHALWMQSIKTNNYDYQIAEIISIGEQEYNILVPAVETAPIDIEPEEEEVNLLEIIEEQPDITIEFVRTAKLTEMSNACHKAIEQGFDLTLRNEEHHFSLDTQDQLNLMTLGTMAQTSNEIPYHADGEPVIFYTAEEIQQIIAATNAHKIYHTTYYNALKSYINSLETIEEIAAVTYGMSIPEEYKTDVLKTLEQ